jgi:hypothetical protein
VRRALEYLAALALAAALALFVLGRRFEATGVALVGADQVALVSDFARGRSHVAAGPGVRVFLPWFQDVELVSRTPGEIRFGGAQDALPPIVVRARDGTTFHFESLVLRFALDLAQARRSLDDVGPLESDRRRLVAALARGVLCDEFGRYRPEEIVLGANLDAARAAARLRLNAHLAPHGITLLEIPPALPRFDEQYEQQVLRRRVAEQQVELVRAERARLASELEQRRQKVAREKEVELAVLTGELARQRTAADTQAVVLRRQAEIHALERGLAGRSERAELEARAQALAARAAAEVEGLAARVAAVASQGASAVRASWIETLAGVSMEFVPFAAAREEPAHAQAEGASR